MVVRLVSRTGSSKNSVCADCNCIVTRGGVYHEILPEPKGFPESKYSHSQLPPLANISGQMIYFVSFFDSDIFYVARSLTIRFYHDKIS